jgi:hypothetical protein
MYEALGSIATTTKKEKKNNHVLYREKEMHIYKLVLQENNKHKMSS